MTDLIDKQICERAGIFHYAQGKRLITEAEIEKLRSIAKEATEVYAQSIVEQERQKNIAALQEEIKQQKRQLTEQLEQTDVILTQISRLMEAINQKNRNLDLEKEVLQKLRYTLEKQ